jgi:hypothetical protein
MTADERNGKVVKLHSRAGKTVESRQRQLANLTPAAAVRHGAYSADRLKPERERVLGELLASFPSVRHDRLELLAGQRARIELLQAYVDQRGIIAHRGRGSTFPAVALLQREESAYRVELSKVEELQREAAAHHPGRALELAEAKYLPTGEDDEGEGA